MNQIIDEMVHEGDFATIHGEDKPLPYKNVWLGVSVENQKAADERIPLLLQTPAAVRFLSCEPLLGPVDLTNLWNVCSECESWEIYYPRGDSPYCEECGAAVEIETVGVDWVIVGGESGPGARPVHPNWIRSLRDQCQAAGVPFFFKQWGEWLDFQDATNPGRVPVSSLTRGEIHTFDDETEVIRVGKRNASRFLDGRLWDEYPQFESEYQGD